MKNLKSIIIFLSVVVFMLVAYVFSSNFFEPKAYNFMVKNFSTVTVGADDIVIIAIDDKSIGRYRWPWGRDLYAKIFDYFNEYTDTKVIGFDALISVFDVNKPSDRALYNSLKEIDNFVGGFSPVYAQYEDKAEGESYNKKFDAKFGYSVKDERRKTYPTLFNSISNIPEAYFEALPYAGSVMLIPHQDGYIRTMLSLVEYNDKLYPSLALRMYAYLENDPEIIVKDYQIKVGNKLKIPSFSSYNGVYNYTHFYKQRKDSEYSYKKYSAIDIIDSYDSLKSGAKPAISPDEFKDKTVFVGANAKALALGLEDVKATPVLLKHPGIDFQATNFQNLRDGEFIVASGWFANFLVTTILLLTAFLLVKNYSLLMSLGWISAITVVYLVFCAICYRFNYAITVITPIMLEIVTMIFAYSYKFILENKNKEKIKTAMGKYISQDIMKDVVKNIDDVKLGGKRANVTVLFADIRGFTSMSEKMTAEEVSVILNEYFTEIEPIIAGHKGVINKFIGDAVMAIFGEPIQDKDHAKNAVLCANDMLKKVEELREKWLSEGKTKIEIGVGINTGEVFVGNIGSEKRMEYTVIGDTVNLASRIESYNKVYKTNFLISDSTYKEVRGIADVIKINEVKIRGKANKMNIYEVLRVNNG